MLRQKNKRNQEEKFKAHEYLYLLLCLVLVAGTNPFGSGNVQSFAQTSDGSLFDVFVYLVPTFSLAVLGFLRVDILKYNLLFVPVSILLLYCFSSVFWAISFNTAFVRFTLYVLVVFAVIFSFCMIEYSRIIRITMLVLTVVMLVDFFSVFLVTNAVHRADDIGEKLYGTWKGVHSHKNHAGPIAAISTFFFFYAYLNTRRLRYAALSIIAFVFLLGTDSRTSVYILFLASGATLAFNFVRFKFSTALARFFVLVLMFSLGLLSPVFVSIADTVLQDRQSFTGRGLVWNALLTYIDRFPLTGAGFSSFWRTGFQNPILQITDGWAVMTGQGHNGYLDAAATIGIPGLLVLLFTFVFIPIFVVLRNIKCKSPIYTIALFLMIYCLSHNMFESSLLNGRNAVNFFVLFYYCLFTKVVVHDLSGEPSSARNVFSLKGSVA